jgi:hypothetical protein
MYSQARFADAAEGMLYFRHAPPLLTRHFELEAYSLKRPQPPYRDAKGWHCSIYYFWWRFLRENEQFRERTAEIGSTEARVQRDFDKAMVMNFPNWWIAQGRFLFCEPQSEGIRVFKQGDDIAFSSDQLVISLPVYGDIERSLSEIRAVLGPVLKQRREEVSPSRARYPIAATMPLNALYKCYNIWRVRRDNPDMKLHEVALCGGLLPNGPLDMADVKRTLAAAAARYIREANTIIENVGRGQFPVKSTAQANQLPEEDTAEPAYVEPEEMREWIKTIHATEPDLVEKYVRSVLPALRNEWQRDD